jgi:hypothetical protein
MRSHPHAGVPLIQNKGDLTLSVHSHAGETHILTLWHHPHTLARSSAVINHPKHRRLLHPSLSATPDIIQDLKLAIIPLE